MKIDADIISIYEKCARQQALFSKLLPAELQNAAVDYYLLYRIMDTIEDGRFPYQLKKDLFEKIRIDFISGLKYSVKKICAENRQEFEYKYLFEKISLILDFHNELPEKYRVLIEKYGLIMAGGMFEFICKFENTRAAKIEFIDDFDEFDRYCYFAAGCVGELNTELFLAYGMRLQNEADEKEFIKCGAQLGNYLQTVNIIRDFSADSSAVEKNYFPANLKNENLNEQLKHIIRHTRAKEKNIELYINSLNINAVYKYCAALYKIAKLHIDYYEKQTGIENAGILKTLIKPQPLKIFFALPLKLKLGFLFYKIGKYCRI